MRRSPPLIVIERRRVPRYPAKQRATAIIDPTNRRGCMITNLSSQGARLELGAVNPLPLRFEIAFATGQRVKVQLIWQHDLQAGVHFDFHPTLWQRLVRRARLRRAL